MRRFSSLLATVLPGVLLAAGAAQAESPTPGYPEPVVQWGVQKDETCEDVAKAVYGSAKHAVLVLRYNRVDCTRGKKLSAGTTLVLPASVTSLPTARLRSLNPDVKARPAGGAWGPAAAGQPLSSNAGVNTLDSGRADIEFIDRTRVFLAANTLVIIYGTAGQSSVSKTPPPAVEVQAGEVKAGLAALRGETVEIAVQGGGRVSASSRETIIERKGERTTTSVYDGKATVSSAGKSVDVPLNHGSRFVGTAAPSPPRPLPPAPAWDAGTSLFVIASADGGQIRAEWSDVKDARAYRVEIARDDTFRDLVVRQEVAATVRSFRADKMPPGRYFVNVRAIDKEDYLGIAAKRTVDVVQIDLGSKNTEFASGEIAANPYAVITMKSGAKTELAMDDGLFGPMPSAIDLARRAPLRLRFRPQGNETPYDLIVRYTEVSANVTTTLSTDSKSAAVSVRFSGLDGIDIAARVAPVLRVNDGKATQSIALAAKDGLWIASVPAPATGGALRLDVVDSRGSILGTGNLAGPKIETPAPLAPNPPAKLPAIGMTTELWQPSPITGVAFWSPTARNAASAAVQTAVGEDGTGFRLQASASAAVDRFGIDASIRSRLFRNESGSDDATSDDGAWLGARMRVLRSDSGDFEAGVSARFGFPVSQLGPSPRFEPALAAGGVRGSFTYLANLGARIRLSDDGTEVPDAQGFALLGGTVNAADWLRLGATLDAHLLHFEAEDATFRGGLSLHLEAGTVVYAALSARLSPWNGDRDGGAIAYGPFSAQLALGLRAR